jgi:LacI family transcriptional regulator
MAALTERSIHADNETGAYAAVKYLIDLGHRRIAHVTGPSAHLHVIARRQGYTRALSDAGIALDPALVVEARWDEESGKQAVEALSQRAEFSAIFAGNDQIAYGAQLALFERGLRVPEDVSLVGFDDQPHSAYTTPPLTTVRQPVEEMGSAAARALVAVLAGEPWSVPKFSTELVVRASAAPPAAGRARLAKR